MKAYPICDPHDGSKGPHYQRVFDPAFHSGIATSKDDYSNLRDHARGEDETGFLPPTSAQLAANPAHTGMYVQFHGTMTEHRKALKAFRQRSYDTIALLRTHVPYAAAEKAIDDAVRKHEAMDWALLVLVPVDVGGLRRSPFSSVPPQMGWAVAPRRSSE